MPSIFLDLPSLTSAPSVEVRRPRYVVLSWPTWDPAVDRGDGPVSGYSVYRRTDDGDWELSGATSLQDANRTVQYHFAYNLSPATR